MDEPATRARTPEHAPPPPPSVGSDSGSTLTTMEPVAYEKIEDTAERSTHAVVLNPSRPATVFVAAGPADREARATRAHDQHSVTIRVNTDAGVGEATAPVISSVQLKSGASFHASAEKKSSSVVLITADESARAPEDGWDDDRTAGQSDGNAPYNYCNSMNSTVISSGQCSPSDTLDSGTCSDLDSTPPPPLPKKKSKSNGTAKGASVTLITFENASRGDSGHSDTATADLDFEDDDSNISCDSLNSSELSGSIKSEESDSKQKQPAATQMAVFVTQHDGDVRHGLLRDIRKRSATIKQNGEEKCWSESSGSDHESTLTSYAMVTHIDKENLKNEGLTSLNAEKASKPPLISESTYEDRHREKTRYVGSFIYDADQFYDFHLNEKVFEPVASVECEGEDPEYFAGVKDYHSEEPASTIRSSKGTIRGVKNRVRAGIATFLQIQTTVKSYKEKDAGKVVLYTTTMGIVRPTYQRCVLVKKILRNLLVKYEERDVFMSTEYQEEIRDRMQSDHILVPQLFVDGQHVGDADAVEKLNENGQLRKMLKPYKSPDACSTCQTCGGFRLLPCRVCSGSKKSLHRNHFTAEFVALKCMNCDEVGLVRCEACC